MAAENDMQLYMKYLTRFLQATGLCISFEIKRKWRYLQCAYCLLLSLLQLLNFVRFCVILLEELNLSVRVMTILAIWFYSLWNAYQTPALAIASAKYMRPFVNELSAYYMRYGSAVNLAKTAKVLKRLYIVAAVLLFPTTCFLVAVNMMTPISVMKISRLYYPFTELNIVLYYIGVCVCTLLLLNGSLAVNAAQVFFFATVRLLAKEFSQINRQVREMVDSDSVEKEPCELLRKRHAHLCELLSTANKIVGHSLFPCFTTQIPTLCCLLFGVIKGTGPLEELTTCIYIIGTGAVNLFSTLIAGACVTSMAHGSLDSLFLCDLSKLTDKAAQVVSLFVARLQGPTIGFTVHGLFTVDASAILMIIGTLFTYAIVMLQLNPGTTMAAVNQPNLSTCAGTS